MKKITLLVAAFLMTVIAVQAQSISFEESEGYTLGEVNGQNNWQVQSNVTSIFTVSDAMASDGVWSLSIAPDTNDSIVDGKIAGGGVDISSDVGTSDQYSVSFDIYVPSADPGEMDAYGTDSQDNVTTRVALFGNNLNVVELNAAGTGLVIAAEAALTLDAFNTVKINYDFGNSEVEYFLNGTSVYSGSFTFTGVELAGIQFYTSGDSQYYIDNIIGTTDMGVENFDAQTFDHYTQNNTLYLNSQSQIGQVVLYNLLGQQVASQVVDATTGNVDLNGLSSGVYLVKVAVGNQAKSFKIVK